MRTQKNKIVPILIVLALFILVAVNSKSIASPFRAGLSGFFTPVLNAFHSVSSFSKKILPFASLRDENAALRKRIGLLNNKIGELQLIADENSRLKDLLGFRKIVPYTTVPAQVIGRDPSNWSNSLIIDKGYNQGVRPNKAVLSTKGLVGRVMEVGRLSSRILLITDTNSKVGVLIHRNRQGGILVGRPDGRCKVIYIALDSDVKKGDKVVTAGFGSVFPKNVLVGEIESINKEPGRLYKYAIVRTAQDLSKLEEVLCIK